MRILIIGGGTVGTLLINKLRKVKPKITVIEKDIRRCEKIAEKYEEVEVINGKAEDTELLSSLDVEKFDLVFVVTGNQGTNIISSIYLNHINAKRIICKLNTPSYIPVLENMGIETVCEDVVTSEQLMIKSFSPSVSMLFSSDIILEEIENYGEKVKEVIEKEKYPVILITQDNKIKIPRIDEKISEKDKVFILKKK